MAITNEKSTQIKNVEASPVVRLNPDDWHGKLQFFRFNFTQGAAAGDIASTQQLIKLPAGRFRVILPLCRIANAAFGAARTLDLGWQGYNAFDGALVAAAAAGLHAAQDVAAAGSFTPGGVIGSDETKLFESRDGVVIEAKVAGGTITAGTTLDGYFIAVAD